MNFFQIKLLRSSKSNKYMDILKLPQYTIDSVQEDVADMWLEISLRYG